MEHCRYHLGIKLLKPYETQGTKFRESYRRNTKRKNEDDVHDVPKQKKMRREEQVVFGETLPYGNVTLSNSFTITPEQFQLHEVERMLGDNIYASPIGLRIYNTMKKENDCKQFDIESGFSPNCDREMCIWKLTWKERIEKKKLTNLSVTEI